MPTHLSRNHPDPFHPNHFYYLPLDILRTVQDVTELDLLDGLLSWIHEEREPSVHDGAILLPLRAQQAGYDELLWTKQVDGKPALASRQSYHRMRARWLAQGWLRDPQDELLSVSLVWGYLAHEDGIYYWNQDRFTHRRKLGKTVIEVRKNFKQATWRTARLRYARQLLAVLRTQEREEAIQQFENISLAPELQAALNTFCSELRLRHALDHIPALHDSAQESLRYYLATWHDPGELLFRPRSYIQQRWPHYFTQKWAPRAVLLALFLKLARIHKNAAESHPIFHATPRLPISLQVEATLDEIRTLATHLLPGLHATKTTQMNRQQIINGISLLAALGVVEADFTTASVTCRLASDRFEQPPTWPAHAVAQALKMTPAETLMWSEPLAALMRLGDYPVTRLHTVWLSLQQMYKSHAYHRLTPADAAVFHRFVLARGRHLRVMAIEEVFTQFAQTRLARRGIPQESAYFSLTAQATALAQVDENLPLTMPTRTRHGISATQILLQFTFPSTMTDDEAAACIAAMLLIVVQRTGAQPISIALPLHRPGPQEIRTTVILDANRLHADLDLSQPIALFLHTSQPDPRIKIRGVIRSFVPPRPRHSENSYADARG